MATEEVPTPDLISAIVCTRNRGASPAQAVKSLLASRHPNYEVLLVDQSNDDETEVAVAPLNTDPRFRYLRSTGIGVSRGRNDGMRAARGAVCCITDDDCEAYPDWLSSMQNLFARHPGVALTFCGVDAGPHDSSAGFIPTYRRTDDLLMTSPREKNRGRGIGAAMAMRPEVVLAQGGFDELLGPGAPFRCCEEGDLATRLLIAGHHVYESRDAGVIHHGFRTWQQGRELSRRDWFGIGAAYIKLLKCGRFDLIGIPAFELWRWAIAPPLNQILRLRKPDGAGRTLYFFQGAWRGWRNPIDRRTMTYIDSRQK